MADGLAHPLAYYMHFHFILNVLKKQVLFKVMTRKQNNDGWVNECNDGPTYKLLGRDMHNLNDTHVYL